MFTEDQKALLDEARALLATAARKIEDVFTEVNTSHPGQRTLLRTLSRLRAAIAILEAAE
jgi:ABC-type transporter Mla subunit MlaD